MILYFDKSNRHDDFKNETYAVIRKHIIKFLSEFATSWALKKSTILAMMDEIFKIELNV